MVDQGRKSYFLRKLEDFKTNAAIWYQYSRNAEAFYGDKAKRYFIQKLKSYLTFYLLHLDSSPLIQSRENMNVELIFYSPEKWKKKFSWLSK